MPMGLKSKACSFRELLEIYQLNNEHNHAFASDSSVYFRNRKLEGEHFAKAINLIQAGANNSSIIRVLAKNGAKPLSKDITNMRSSAWEIPRSGRMGAALLLLEEDDYTVQFKRNDQNEMHSIFFYHKEAVTLAKRFPEVLVIDCTYKTIMYDMHFVNMVSVSNIGGITLKNFFVAGAWTSNEDEQCMTWVLSTLRAIVYDGSDNPTRIVVDSAKATRNAIASVYPKSNILLCTWHIQRNFHTECFKHFDNQKDLQSLQSAVN